MAVDLEAAKAMLASRPKSSSSSNGNSQSLRFLKVPPTGEIKLRFLPPIEGKKIPGKLVWKHYHMPDIKAVTCLRTYDKTCPVCKVVEDFRLKMDDETISDFESKVSAYFNVLVLEGGFDTNGKPCNPKLPYLLNCGEYNYWWLLDQISNPDVGDITDPITGSSVVFRRKKTNGALDRIIARQASPIASSDEEVEAILSQMFDMDKVWKNPDDEYLQKVLMTAKALKLQLQERIESLSSNPVTEAVNAPKPEAPAPKQEVQPSEDVEQPESKAEEKVEAKSKPAPAPEKKKEEAKPASTPDKVNGFAKPANAKPCFGQHKDCDECLECEDELECEMFTENAG